MQLQLIIYQALKLNGELHSINSNKSKIFEQKSHAKQQHHKIIVCSQQASRCDGHNFQQVDLLLHVTYFSFCLIFITRKFTRTKHIGKKTACCSNARKKQQCISQNHKEKSLFCCILVKNYF
jgi:hypothetical protein